MNYQRLKEKHTLRKEHSLFGRYINYEQIDPLLTKHAGNFKIDEIGQSVEGRKIHSVTLGHGSVKVLAWSQMHGNESTTTKAVFDLFNFFAEAQGNDFKELLQKLTLMVIPMLNPDGAERYTRLNANEVDLNRDAQQLSQPESKILQQLYTSFRPDFALNLHGQRTIFGVGEPPRSASVSLLSPAQDADRKVTPARVRGMQVIGAINEMLQEYLPKGVGRYDDSFNLNCVGDTLQHLNIPTVLFEAGHIQGDYEREKTRVFIVLALIKALETIAAIDLKVPSAFDQKNYFYIPENQKCFYDFIVRNVQLPEGIIDIAVHFEEKLVNKCLKFIPKIEKIGELSFFAGHSEYDFKGSKPAQNPSNQWKEGAILERISGEDGITITFSTN